MRGMWSRLCQAPAWVVFVGGLVCITGVAVLDFVTGVDWSLLLFSVIPVGAVAWCAGWPRAVPHILVASFGTAAAALNEDGNIVRAVWNTGTRALFLLGGALLLSRLRASMSNEYWRARTDALTGAFNRHAFEERAELELARARRSPLPLSAAFFDLDGLKWVNDHHGHEAGDELLRAFADAANEHIRATDALARVGGDEFVALLPGADRPEAVRVIDRIVAEFARYRPATGGASLSVGLVVWAGQPPEDVQELVSAADALMYNAKRRGGAQVITREVVPTRGTSSTRSFPI